MPGLQGEARIFFCSFPRVSEQNLLTFRKKCGTSNVVLRYLKLVCGPFSQLGRGLGDPSEDTSYLAQATREIFVWKLDDLNGVAAARSGPKILPASNAALCLNNDEEEAKDDLSLRRQLSEDQIEPATEMIRGMSVKQNLAKCLSINDEVSSKTLSNVL